MFSLYKKELQSYMYSPLAYVLSAVFMLIFSWTFISWITSLETSVMSFSFPEIFYNYFFYFVFIIPMLTMKSFAEERKLNTEVLLMSTPLNVFKIVMAKFIAISTVLLFMMALTLIFPIITMAHGAVVWSSLICGYIGFYTWGIACAAIGMLASSFTENQIIAAIIGEAAMIFLLFVDSFSQNEFLLKLPVVSGFLESISPRIRFTSFAMGVFSLSDLVFYLSFIAVVLCWTMISVEKRRWSRG